MENTSREREIWLDGLRGVAAVIVAWFHFTAGHLAAPYRSFWDSPKSENRHLIQLAPFRLIFSGQGMVCMFFVVSGYSISIGLVKLRNEASRSTFYQRLVSSVFRRVIRLSLPILALMVASHTLFYAGLYTRPFPKGTGCVGAVPRGSLGPHLQCPVRSFFDILSARDNQDASLNDHLWTIPIEIRGSMAVYLTQLGLSTVKQTVRSLVILLLCIQSWYNESAHFMAFYAGLLFAELDGRTLAKKQELVMDKHIIPTGQGKKASSQKISNLTWMLGKYTVFFLGVYLLSLPMRLQADGTWEHEFTTDWFFLKWFPLLSAGDFETVTRVWHTFGAILVFGSMRHLPLMRAPFETRIAQFLGHISFGLYLCHQPVFRVLSNACLRWLCLCISRVDCSDAREKGDWATVFVAWITATPLIWAILVVMSKYMAKVDHRSIQVASHVETSLS